MNKLPSKFHSVSEIHCIEEKMTKIGGTDCKIVKRTNRIKNKGP